MKQRRWAFWATFGLMGLIMGLWSMASPLMAGLDEPAHLIKAAAVVRGDLVGAPYVDPAATERDRAQQGGRAVVEVTALFEQLPDLPYCFAFRSEVQASCQPALVADPDAPSSAVTSAARYNPLYYAIVGLPTLLPGSAATLYLSRLVSVVLAASLIASAARTVIELGRPRWPMAGIAVAVTPMVVFLCSTVNPQSVEIAGALLVWVSLLALVREPDPELLRRRCTRLTIGTVVLVNARGLGPMFLLVILCAVLVCTPWRTVAAILRDRRTWPFVGLCGLATAGALSWSAVAGTLDTPATATLPEYADTETIVKLTIGMTSDYLRQMLGWFGWLDTPMPEWTYLLAAAVLLFVVAVGFALAGGRERLALGMLAAVVILLPIATQYVQSRYIGIFWQGRYLLPVLIGIPLIAAFAVDRREPVPDWISRRLVTTVLGAVATVQVVAFAVNLHRYVNGWDGSWFRTAGDSWRPPLPAALSVVAVAVGWVAVDVLAGRQSRPAGDLRPAAHGAAPTDTTRAVSTYAVSTDAVSGDTPTTGDPR